MQKGGYPSSDMDQGSPYDGMDLTGGTERIDGEDAEIDNRIKEILLTSHNLYLIAQMHEKEILDLSQHMKDLPQMIGNIIRTSIGELGGATDDKGLPVSGNGGISPAKLIGALAAVSIIVPLLTVLFIRLLVV